MSKKTLIEESLLDLKNIKDALNANTKEILRSVTKEEIESIVVETLKKENVFEEEDITDDSEELDLEPVATDAEAEDTETADVPSSEDEVSDIETPAPVDSEIEPVADMDAVASDVDDLDMTSASDDEIISVFKKLSGEDEVEVVGDEIHLDITEPGEYIIKAGETTDEVPTPDDLEPVATDDEAEYEIEMADDSTPETETEPTEEVPSTEDETEQEEDEIEEQISTNRVAQNRAGGDLTKTKGPGAKQGASLNEVTEKYNKILTESKNLKNENEQFKKIVGQFKKMLAETVVFNSNLTYAVRLFTEHAVTKDEKLDIIKRFDGVKDLTESKVLYKKILNEITSKKSVKDKIEEAVNKDITSGASKQLTENTAFVNPEHKRMLALMNHSYKK